MACSEESEISADVVMTLRAVAKSYGEHSLFVNVSLKLSPGQAVAVVGRNGSGKSTLLRCIAGADEFDAGTVELCGTPLVESDAKARGAMATLLDDVDYFPDLSVLEHLRLVAWMHGSDEADELVDRVVSDSGLEEVAHQLPPTLSSGQKHRLGLASCFVRPRKLLVLDEPEQRLDTAGREWLSSRLLEEKRVGTAVLFASHDPNVISIVADDVMSFQ